MKTLHLFFTLNLLTLSYCLAQTRPANKSTTPATTPANTNRLQQLYDEHHGITKKPAATAPATSRPKPQAGTSVTPQPAPTVSQKPDLRINGKPSGTRIGLRAGVTYPFFTELQTGIDPAIGFVGGVAFTFGARTVAFQPEINYTRYSQKVTAFNFTSTESFDVLEVPLFLKLSSGSYAGSRFFLNIGPYAAYAMSESVDGKAMSLNGTKGRLGFGAGAGVGAAVKAGPGHITLEVRGLYPLGDTYNGFSTDSKTIFGQGTVGYIVPLGGRYP